MRIIISCSLYALNMILFITLVNHNLKKFIKVTKKGYLNVFYHIITMLCNMLKISFIAIKIKHIVKIFNF